MACRSSAGRQRVLGRQGLDLVRARAGRRRSRIAPALERAALRPAAGPQPAGLGGASAARCSPMKAAGPAALCRHHHLGGPAPWRDRADHARASRSISCRSPTTCSTARSSSALLPLARERGIAVIVNRPFREGALLRGCSAIRCRAWAAEIGCDELGAARAEVHRLASGGDLRDPGDHAASPTCARTWPRRTAAARRSAMRAAHGRACRGSSELMSEWWTYRLVRLPAVLAAHLLPAVRALQRAIWPLQIVALALGVASSCSSCAAARGAAASSRRSSPRSGSGSRGPISGALRDDQLGGAVFRGRLSRCRRRCLPGPVSFETA